MCVQFIAKTHMFFTGGKDGKVKQWDGDTFEHILTLEVCEIIVSVIVSDY